MLTPFLCFQQLWDISFEQLTFSQQSQIPLFRRGQPFQSVARKRRIVPVLSLKRAMKFLGRNGKHTRSAVQRLAIAVEIPAVDPLNLGTGLEYQDLFRAYGHSSLRCFRLSICLKGAVAGVSALDRVERI